MLSFSFLLGYQNHQALAHSQKKSSHLLQCTNYAFVDSKEGSRRTYSDCDLTCLALTSFILDI